MSEIQKYNPNGEIQKVENESDTEQPENPEQTEQRELTETEIIQFSKDAIEAITGKEFSAENLTAENYKDKIEQAVMESVADVPDELAEKFGVDAEALNGRADEILQQVRQETDSNKLAELQHELIYQYITLISRVQNQADRGITPALAKETQGMDCTLSAWSLKQKLESAQVPNLKFEFAYPSGHATGFITDAAGRHLYVDAQNGFIAEVQTKEVQDLNNPDTAYPIHEVIESKILKGHIPNEGEVAVTRPGGSDYVPKYMGIRPDGIYHTLGNFHMLVNRESPVYNTQTATKFRESLNNSPEQWQQFQQLVDKVAGGKVIQETMFDRLSSKHHSEYETQKSLKEVREKLNNT